MLDLDPFFFSNPSAGICDLSLSFILIWYGSERPLYSFTKHNIAKSDKQESN